MKASGLWCTSLHFLLFTTLATAWPWPDLLSDAKALVRRQDDNPSSKQDSATPTVTQADDDSDSAAASTITDSASTTDGSDSKSTKTTGKASKTTPVDPRLPPGGIQMITPAVIEGSQYYKVGDQVTFAWNYTSLSITPSAVDVFASCTLNSATYTIASNMSVEETGQVIWDTGESQSFTAPFPVATYTLYIHDAAHDVTDVPSAGRLGNFDTFQFGMYTGQPYRPLNEFRCATCGAAMSIHEQQALGVLVVTSVITVLSFTWFANGFGVFG